MWDLIVPDISEYNLDIICISETWFDDPALCDFYSHNDFVPFFDTYLSLRSGGTLLLINLVMRLKSTNLKRSVSTDALNISAVIIGPVKSPMSIAVVYRASLASRIDTEDLMNNFGIFARKMPFIFTGDFNLGLISWLNSVCYTL